jgi:hypothetical protein
VNAAIATRAFNFKFPHVSADSLPGAAEKNPNPFFEVWVNRLILSGFLTTTDIRNDIPSLLNGKIIDDGASWLQQYEAEQLPEPRRWIANPLTVFLTVTNLCGLPYKVQFSSGLSQSFVNHADFARFAVHYSGQPAFEPRPDELYLLSVIDRPQTVRNPAEATNCSPGSLIFFRAAGRIASPPSRVPITSS